MSPPYGFAARDDAGCYYKELCDKEQPRKSLRVSLIAEIVDKRHGQMTQVLTNVLSPDGNTIGIVYVRPGSDGTPDSVSFATYERIK